MISTQQPPIEQGHAESGSDWRSSDLFSAEPHGVSFGVRLHAAREARGLDLEACAHALKLPARVLRQLEQNQYDGIDSRLYLASYIGTYGRHLGIDEASVQLELDRIKQIEPVLVATGGISHSRFLLDRYATAATYVVLTAVIVVPMVWMGIRGTLNRDISHLAPLDAAPVAQLSVASSASSVGTPLTHTLVAAPVVMAPPVQQEQPLMASMVAFPGMDNSSIPPAQASRPVSDSQAGGHSVSLSLTAASWVEVIAQDGTRLEYGLLPAGTDKTWHSDQPLDVRIGNVSGAQMRIDGQPVELSNFRRDNVAHFSVQLHDGKASAASL